MSESAKILVVDDSQMILAWTKDVLRDAGYTVDAADHLRLDDYLRHFEPDLILMDVEIGEKGDHSGASVAGVLKNVAATRDTAIVLYSGLAETELAELARAQGADGYIYKTEDSDQLVREVAAFLGGS